MRRYWLGMKILFPFSSVLLAWILLVGSASALIPEDWWPDPATNRGLSVWLAYSREYDALYRDLDQDPTHDQLVQQDIAAMLQEGVQVVFVALSSSPTTPHLQTLSTRTDPFTMDVQSYVNRLDAQGIRACAAILSNNFTGDPGQLDRFTLVDHLVDFNRNRGPGDAGFRCVATDLEMARGSRSTAVYDLWKQFHQNMKVRIAAGGSDLRLLAWMQGPDFLIDTMDNVQDQTDLMTRENIKSCADSTHPCGDDQTDPHLYTGAIRYFTTQDGAATFDAFVPMWYFASQGPYMRRLQHNFDELHNLAGDKPFLIAGTEIRNDTGLCCVDGQGNPVCLRSRSDYLARLDFNDTFRVAPFIFIGTAVFKWPIPADWTCLVSSSASLEIGACAAK